MPTRKIKSLHYNLPFQDPYIGGKNVIFHRSHRSKKGRKLFKTTKNRDFFDNFEEKIEKYDELEEKRCKILDY